MYKIPAKTLFIGKNLVFVPECPSTNTLALEISQRSRASDGTVVITDNQTAGRGQRGNTWESDPVLNLTFSLVLKPAFLPVSKQFYLNIVISLGLLDYVKGQLPDTVYVKWPNDILVHRQKISGILIENQLYGSTIVNTVVGIGFNLNQRRFSHPSATSLSLISGKVYDRSAELEEILINLEQRYFQLRRGEYSNLMGDYLAALYLRNEEHTFTAEGRTFEGVIRDVDEWGKLRVESPEGIRSFGIKEISFER